MKNILTFTSWLAAVVVAAGVTLWAVATTLTGCRDADDDDAGVNL